MSAEVTSAIAAVISAIGTVFATWAAFRSAGSAQLAQKAAAEAERRSDLRQLCITAGEVLVEFRRVESRAVDAKQAYTTLFTFSGNSSGSRRNIYISAIEEKSKTATQLQNHAQLFISPPKNLGTAPLDEIDRIQTKLSNSLTEMRALRQDLEREHASVESQNAVYQEKVIHSLPR